MNALWLKILIMTSFSILMVNSKFDLDFSIRLAHCRASCLYRIKTSRITDRECRKSFNCSQCWEACELAKSLPSLCAQTDCGPGCLETCRFHFLSPTHTSQENVLVLSDSGIAWPPVTSSAAVFIVEASGLQLCQTLEPRTTLPPNVDPATVRVLAVDWQGLVRVLGPQVETPVFQALRILQSLGLEDKLGLKLQAEIDGLESRNSIQILTTRESSTWGLKLESIHHQPSLIRAKISWWPFHNQLAKSSLIDINYLVTWTVYGAVLRGNLLTNTSSVTLSLWPDTMYMAQVSLLSLESSNIQSELLVLDTHRIQPEISNSTSSHREGSVRLTETRPLNNPHIESDSQKYGEQGEVIGRVLFMVFVFMGVIIASTWRRRYCQSSSPYKKVVNQGIDSLSLYRDLPTTRMMFAEPYINKTDLSSMEKLLYKD